MTLDEKILGVINAEGGRFHRPGGWAIDCLAQHLPDVARDKVLRRVIVLAKAGTIRVTRGEHTVVLLEVVA